MSFIRRRRTRPSSLLLVTIGAVAGVAIGALLAERSGGLEGLVRGLGGSGGRRRPRQDGWRSEGRGEDEYTPSADEDSELAPEAISHMHVRGRAQDVEDASDVEALEELEERVLDAFQNDPILAERAIDIGAVDTSTIELTGWVRAPSEIGHALTLARGVPGVQAVVDRLAVRGAEQQHPHIGNQFSGLHTFDTQSADATLRND